MRKLVSSLIAVAISAVSFQSMAQAEVEITWKEPKKYTDVRPANESSKRFRERVFRSLEEYVVELAEDLPDGQKLEMTVTDVDLAGQVWPSSFVGLGTGGTDTRLIKRVDIPRMEFSYKLTDANGQIVKQSEEVKLKDMAFQDRFNPMFDSESFRYEKNMLRDWFNSEFEQQMVK